ncbi:MAG: hypothetical protein ACRYFK_09305 [Janthinobacterium lividum]
MRFANSAVRQAAALQRRGLPGPALVRQALGAAAMQHAPGLLRPRNPNGTFRSVNGPATRRFGSGGAPRRPQYGPAVAYGVPTAYGYPGAGYAPAPDQGDEGYEGDEEQTDGNQNGYGAPPRHRATRGTWLRRGRTLVIQL